MGLLPLWTYLTLAAFLVGCAWKAFRYATMPMHLRWELYPVAHEKGKASYGGSYFEELDWWTKPIESSKLGEVKVIAEEVLTLKAVRENNPSLWPWSLAFHYGLYLLFGLGVALIAGGGVLLTGFAPLQWLAGGRVLSVWGAAGIALALIGCVGLLVRRLANPGLRRSSTPADFFHLVLLLGVFAASAGSWLAIDREYAVAAGYMAVLMSGKPVTPPGGWFSAQILLLGAFLLYLPFSHMTHMFTKYFTWHSVRWDDRPNRVGSRIEARAARLLMLPVHWSAPHIQGDGRKTWADVAQHNNEEV